MGRGYEHFRLPSNRATWPTDRLRWKPSRDPGTPKLLVYTAGRVPTVSDFSAALRNSNIVDSRVTNIPGGVVALPLGSRLLARYRAEVRRHLEAMGLIEYEYPNVVAAEQLKRTDALFALKDKVLYVGDDNAWAAGSKRFALGPTGEAAIYSHWARVLKTERDLPLKVFRQSNYFRPLTSGKHSGSGVYKSLEAHDVFEIHSAFAEGGEAEEFVSELTRGIAAFVDQLPLPVVWGPRPLAFNHGRLSKLTVGGDALLPSGGTIQVASVYEQGQVFSQAFNVGFKRDGVRRHTHQVTAALTRRLFFVMLQYGLRDDRRVFVHPDLAPNVCAVVVQDEDALKQRLAGWAIDVTEKTGRSCATQVKGKQSFKQLMAWAQGQGASILAFVRAGAPPRVTLVRFDDYSECDGALDETTSLGAIVQDAATDIRMKFRRATDQFAAAQIDYPKTVEDAKAVLSERRIAVCHASDAHGVLEQVESMAAGEILSQGATVAGQCMITGATVATVCAVAHRL